MAEHLAAVRALLEGQRFGVLSTLSARYAGWPFGSVTPYALDGDGLPILLLSQLAEHTRNIAADARASLFVRDEASDPLAGARVTLLGRVERAEGAELRARYVARHPEAEQYFEMADFAIYVLRPTSARFVGGFGEMGWVDLAPD